MAAETGRARNAESKKGLAMVRRTAPRGHHLGGECPADPVGAAPGVPSTRATLTLSETPSRTLKAAPRRRATERRGAAGTAAHLALLLISLTLGSVVGVQRRLAVLRQVQVELREAGCRDGRRGVVPDAMGAVVGSARVFQRLPVVVRLAPLRPGRRRAARDQRRNAGPKHGPAGAAPPTRRPPARPGGLRTLGHVGFRQ